MEEHDTTTSRPRHGTQEAHGAVIIAESALDLALSHIDTTETEAIDVIREAKKALGVASDRLTEIIG